MSAPIRAHLYNKKGVDTPLDPAQIELEQLNDDRLLWVDVDLSQEAGLGDLWRALEVENELGLFDHQPKRPTLIVHEKVLQLAVHAIDPEAEDLTPTVVHCFLGSNWLVTLHVGELDLFENFNEGVTEESQLGGLDAAGFLSVVIDWHLNGYLRIVERLQTESDQVDEELLHWAPNKPKLLSRLYELQRQVTRLRLILSPHRDVFGP